MLIGLILSLICTIGWSARLTKMADKSYPEMYAVLEEESLYMVLKPQIGVLL